MRYFLLFGTLTTLLYTGCAHKVRPQPILTKTSIKIEDITAPRRVGTYTLTSQKRYDDQTLGIALRYADLQKKDAFLDCFIYPKKIDKDLESHYKDFIDTLKYMKKKGEFKSFEVLKEDEVMLDSQTKAKRALFRITNKSVPYYSVAYLADLGDKFFKVRISNALEDRFLHSDLGWNATRELYTAVKRARKPLPTPANKPQ